MIVFVVVMQADLATNKIPSWASNMIADNSFDAIWRFVGTPGFRKYTELGFYVAKKEGYVLAQYDLDKNEYLPSGK